MATLAEQRRDYVPIMDRPTGSGVNPMQDRGYLNALMQRGAHDPLRLMAEKQLEELDREEARGQQKQLIEEGRAQRGEQFEESQQARGDRAAEMQGYREDLLKQRQEAGKDRDLNAQLQLMQLTSDPKVKSQIQNNLMSRFGIDPTQMPAGSDRGNAVKQFLAKGGQPVTTAPTGAAVGTPANVEQPGATGAPKPFSIENLPQRPGFDYNTSTGEFVPKSTVGTIGGRPAGDVIAEGAQRTGISPESPSGITGLAKLQPNPATNEAMVPTPSPNAISSLVAPTGNVATVGTPPATPPGSPTTTSPWSFKPLLGEGIGGAIDRGIAGLPSTLGADTGGFGALAARGAIPTGTAQPQPAAKPTPEEIAAQLAKNKTAQAQ